MQIRRIVITDIASVKLLADGNRDALGFNPVRKFEEIVAQSRGFVAVVNQNVVGFVAFRHRKVDLQTTLSEICVQLELRGRQVGTALIAELVRECKVKSREFIQLKCPTDLPANRFYQQLGFLLHSTETGKRRSLNVWRLNVPHEPISKS